MSGTVAIVVMVVVIVVVGGSGYVALGAISRGGTHTFSTCAPPTSPVCQSSAGLNDVILTVPYGAGFGQAITTIEQGTSIPATVATSGGEGVTTYQIFWGDGSNYTGGDPTANHVYPELGWYVISARALVGSTWHAGPWYLYPIEVTPNEQTTSTGFYPTFATSFTNGSSVPTQFGWLEGSGSVRVSATYTANSTATGYTDAAPVLTSTGGVQSNLSSTPTHVAASYTFNSPGLYYITMVGAIAAPSGTIYQNYTWTVYVSPTGVAPGCRACVVIIGGPSSPHPGEIIYQEVAPGAITEDPSVAYDVYSAEPVFNVYQTLVQYNGSRTDSFLPVLSLCVPGPDCMSKYGHSMVVNNATTGSPEYWTFPIDPAARFYDPATGANWSVYPSDVAFTFARTCGFADLPGVGSQPGWIQCQALLPNGSFRWDSGLHAPYNNTPRGLFSAILVNDSEYCPASVMQVSNGCITFDAGGGGVAWSFFLQLVADPVGAGVEPCGWFTDVGAGVPGFPKTSAANGDGPCYLPGATPGTTSTNSTSFRSWLSSTPPTYWDNFQLLSLDGPAIQPGVQWAMVGSGPYYLVNSGGPYPFAQSVGYTLEQNPAYHAPTGCAGQPNCEPLPGPTHYVAKVIVVYQPTDTVGIEQYKAGLTDFATIRPTETSQLLSLIQEGKIGAFTFPTLDVYMLSFALEFSPSAAKEIDPNALTVPWDFFSYVGLRQFLVHAFPYATIENTILTSDGVQYGFSFGGAIPQEMGNYYPTNISWPSGDPVSNSTVNGSAAWWWAQATNSKSPYYDPELASCSTSSPCQFPIVGVRGDTAFDEVIQDYLPYINSLSGGALEPNTFDLGFVEYLGIVSALPGQWGVPSFVDSSFGPDYPDPTDYMTPYYYPNASYTGGDAVEEGLSLFTCSGAQAPTGMPADSNSMAALLYWANIGPIPQPCQGNSYAAMEFGMFTAAGMAVGPPRVLMYNLVEHIANQLALYVYIYQQNIVISYASWINPTTINTNPLIGANHINTWYLCGGNGVIPP